LSFCVLYFASFFSLSARLTFRFRSPYPPFSVGPNQPCPRCLFLVRDKSHLLLFCLYASVLCMRFLPYHNLAHVPIISEFVRTVHSRLRFIRRLIVFLNQGHSTHTYVNPFHFHFSFSVLSRTELRSLITLFSLSLTCSLTSPSVSPFKPETGISPLCSDCLFK